MSKEKQEEKFRYFKLVKGLSYHTADKRFKVFLGETVKVTEEDAHIFEKMESNFNEVPAPKNKVQASAIRVAKEISGPKVTADSAEAMKELEELDPGAAAAVKAIQQKNKPKSGVISSEMLGEAGKKQ